MGKYLNFTFQLNKFKKTDKDTHWVGYAKNPDGTRFYFVKIFKNQGQYGEFMSGSIDMEKLGQRVIEDEANPSQEPDSNFQEDVQEFPSNFPI